MSEELRQKKWESCEVSFMPQFMKTGPSPLPSFNATYSGNMAGSGNCALRCIRCGDVVPLDPCANCGGDGFIAGLTTNNVAGLFCVDCERGFSSWTCQSCGTRNPINKSVVKPKKGCFIATAACGSYDAPEVQVLRRIRDEIMSSSRMGKALISFYYTYSPPVAGWLAHHPALRVMVRRALIVPLACVSRIVLNHPAHEDNGDRTHEPRCR